MVALRYFNLLFLALLTLPVSAGEISTYVWMNSYHWDRTKEYNETHEILGLEYKGFYIEGFNNSKNNDVQVVGYIKRDYYCGKFNLCYGAELAVIKGYGSRIRVLPMPVISFKGKEWGLDVRLFGTEGVAFRFRYILEY